MSSAYYPATGKEENFYCLSSHGSAAFYVMTLPVNSGYHPSLLLTVLEGIDSMGNSPHTGNTSTAGRSQLALPAPERTPQFEDIYEVEEVGTKDVEMA